MPVRVRRNGWTEVGAPSADATSEPRAVSEIRLVSCATSLAVPLALAYLLLSPCGLGCQNLEKRPVGPDFFPKAAELNSNSPSRNFVRSSPRAWCRMVCLRLKGAFLLA